LLHVSFTSADVVFVCNVANGPIVWIPRLFGKPTVLNVDGFDRKRKKWNLLGQSALYICELFSAFTPTRVVTDSRIMQDYYWRHYRRRSTMIAYGAEEPPNGIYANGASPKLSELPTHGFILYVSRLEPENNPELLLESYSQVQTNWPLVIVGGNSYKPAYVERLKSLADRRVLFLGPVYGSGYWQLLRNAGLYVFGCEVGGVHPALIEAMAAGKPILYLDTPENRETAGEAGVPFRADSGILAAEMSHLLADAKVRQELGRRARERATSLFGWEETTRKYEDLFAQLLHKFDARQSGP
jgi:glycosyltransferase involved in cell wall biosynthesis